MKYLFLALLVTGCTAAQLKQTNDVYEEMHKIRVGLEAIPGVTLVADSYCPWMKDVRVGLDATYGIKTLLDPLTATAGAQ